MKALEKRIQIKARSGGNYGNQQQTFEDIIEVKKERNKADGQSITEELNVEHEQLIDIYDI